MDFFPKNKIEKAWCEIGNINNNPILEIMRNIICHEFSEVIIERPTKFGGNMIYNDYNEIELDFVNKKLHPIDLKLSATNYLIKIIKPIRNKLRLDEKIIRMIDKKI